MDNIDWVRIKETEGNVAANFQEDSDSEPEAIDVKSIYRYWCNLRWRDDSNVQPFQQYFSHAELLEGC